MFYGNIKLILDSIREGKITLAMFNGNLNLILTALPRFSRFTLLFFSGFASLVVQRKTLLFAHNHTWTHNEGKFFSCFLIFIHFKHFEHHKTRKNSGLFWCNEKFKIWATNQSNEYQNFSFDSIVLTYRHKFWPIAIILDLSHKNIHRLPFPMRVSSLHSGNQDLLPKKTICKCNH